MLLVAQAAAQPDAPITIRIASNAADDITPLLYAQKTGMFAKAGLDVQIQRMNSGDAVTAAVIGCDRHREVEPHPLINAHVHGVQLEIVAPGDVDLRPCPFRIVVKKNSPITSARDLYRQDPGRRRPG